MARTFSVPERVLTPCPVDLYPQVLRFLDKAFAKKGVNWFAKHYSHIFNLDPDSIRNHRVYFDRGKLAGVMGIYPFGLKIGRAVLKVGGLGSVSTHPEARGRGVMSDMLGQVTKILDATYDVSWLGGDRFRYRNYGWELGGRIAVFAVNKRDLLRYFPNAKAGRCRTATAHDIPFLSSWYRRLPTGVTRNRAEFNLRLNRTFFGWTLADSAAGKGYLVYNKEDPKEIHEISGDNAGIISLLLAHFAKHGLDKVDIASPDAAETPSAFLHHICTWHAVYPCSQMRVCNVASAWEKLCPEMIVRNYPDNLTSAIAMFDSLTDDKDRRIVLGRALGFLDATPPMPKRLRGFEKVRPLKWHLSTVDGV